MLCMMLPELRVEGIILFLQHRAKRYLKSHSDVTRNNGRWEVHANRVLKVPFFDLIMHFGATLCNSRADTSPDKERDDISNFGALDSGE